MITVVNGKGETRVLRVTTAGGQTVLQVSKTDGAVVTTLVMTEDAASQLAGALDNDPQ
jgi:hypothetical protein